METENKELAEIMGMKDSFNGGYIKASEEAHTLLEDSDYGMSDDIPVASNGYYVVHKDNDYIIYCQGENSLLGYKQFYINNGKLSWEEPKGKEMHYLNHDDFLEDIENKTDTISISDGDKDEHFAKFGFEVPDFDARILALDMNKLIGIVYLGIIPFAIEWDAISGEAFTKTKAWKDKALTPIPQQPKQWYEDESNFPTLVVGMSGIATGVKYFVSSLDEEGLLVVKNSITTLSPENVRLFTIEERNSLYCLDSEV